MQLREEDMFYINVSVPRITRKQVEEMEASIPGLLSVASIPIIEKEKDAIKIGVRMAVKKTVGREFVVKDNAIVKETPSGWDITFRGYGRDENRQHIAETSSTSGSVPVKTANQQDIADLD